MYHYTQRYVVATVKTIKTTSKGYLQINAEIKPRYCQEALRLFGKPGTIIRLAREELTDAEDTTLDLNDNFGNH